MNLVLKRAIWRGKKKVYVTLIFEDASFCLISKGALKNQTVATESKK